MKGELRPLTSELEEGVIAAESYSFSVGRETVPVWMGRAGRDNVRVWVVGGRVAGATLIIPMGIWFGGRSVKNLGIAGVAVGPEHRGRGHGYEMMAEILREARRNSFAVTTLYPATITLYRKCGYELAGGYYGVKLALGSLSVRANEGEIVPVTLADREQLSAIQRPLASAHDGNLDRGPYVWERIFSPRLQDARGFAVSFDGTLEGYVILRPSVEAAGSPYHDLSITDLVARTPRAIHRLLAFLAEHRSLAMHAHWHGGPHDPFLSVLPEKPYETQVEERWMLRILDVKAAFEARGYRAERAAAVEIEIEDPEIRENCGRVRVEVENGRAQVTAPRGGPVLRGKIGAVSSLYSGYQPASTLAQMGWLEGDAAALEAADHIFAGRTPWMSEMF